MPATLINGEARDSIAVSDRAFQYGDGVFETVRVAAGMPTLWSLHLERLRAGCDFLRMPLNVSVLEEELACLLGDNTEEGIVKIIVSRGSGGRGYGPSATALPVRVLQFFPLPAVSISTPGDGIRARVCSHPLSQNTALTRYKHLCRLDQVIASRELSDQTPEGIMLTDDGLVIEGTRSNIFLVRHGKLQTPGLSRAGVQGVMREFLLARFRAAGIDVETVNISLADLLNASEFFFCNSVFGVCPVKELEHAGQYLAFTIGPLTRQAVKYADEAILAQT